MARRTRPLRAGRSWFRHSSVWESTAQGSGSRQPIGGGDGGGGRGFRASGGMMEFTLPFRAYSAANWVAMFAQRHFHEFGTTREQLAQIALNARKNAETSRTPPPRAHRILSLLLRVVARVIARSTVGDQR